MKTNGAWELLGKVSSVVKEQGKTGKKTNPAEATIIKPRQKKKKKHLKAHLMVEEAKGSQSPNTEGETVLKRSKFIVRIENTRLKLQYNHKTIVINQNISRSEETFKRELQNNISE